MSEATIGALATVVVALVAALAQAYRSRPQDRSAVTDGYDKLVTALQADNAALRALTALQATRIEGLEEGYERLEERFEAIEREFAQYKIDHPSRLPHLEQDVDG